jgi:KaiC/GvpD/RAD55 family RecA-like ATPase
MATITQLELTILTAYVSLEYFNRATASHIDHTFFEAEEVQSLVKDVIEYTKNHQYLPNKTTLKTIIEGKKGLREKEYQNIVELIDTIYSPSNLTDVSNCDATWLLSTTETWCKERSVFNAIIKAMDILDGKVYENKAKVDKSAIPDLMQKALAISFDRTIGHNYIDDYSARFDFLHSPVSKIPFYSTTLNRITGGGIERKAMTLLVCPPHAGKSLTMASWGADWTRMGYNVLIISLEMAEMKIGERVDANMLNVDIGDLSRVPKRTYDKKFEKFVEDGYGKMIIKEYPTSGASASHFRYLLQELKMKESFIPDIVLVDYMGICVSSRIRSDNMYQVQKAVGEELRGLSQEFDFALVTAVQTNKNGYNGADIEMGDISESSGHAMTADFAIALISTEELIALGQVRIKQLKNRWGSIHDLSSFLMNMDRKKMKLWEEDPYLDVSKFRKPIYEQKVVTTNNETIADKEMEELDIQATALHIDKKVETESFDYSTIKSTNTSKKIDISKLIV